MDNFFRHLPQVVPQGLAKALVAVVLYGTADLSRRAVEAVPYVQ
jgi:hypothetical protein